MSRRSWIVLMSAFGAVAVTVNWMLPWPDINDFTGLARICLLVDDRGLSAVSNNNWGFAHPLLNCGLTEATGNLLVSQRLLSALAALLVLVLAERLMARVVQVSDPRARLAFLLVLTVSPWMSEALLSVHLDVFPIALLLGALCLLRANSGAGHFLGGLLAGMGFWFRFQFLWSALLYVPLVALFRWHDRPYHRAGQALAGSVVGIVVPIAVNLLATGALLPSNARGIFGRLNPGPDYWSAENQEVLMATDWAEILGGIDWFAVLARGAEAFLFDGPLTLLLVVVAWHTSSRTVRAWRSSSGIGQSRLRDTAREVASDPAVLLFGFLLVSWVPFLVIRTFTLRLEATLWLLAFPVLAGIYGKAHRRLQAGLIIALLALVLALVPARFSAIYSAGQYARSVDRQVASIIPLEVRRDSPNVVLDLDNVYYNQHNRYWLFNPVVFGGWGARWEPFRSSFGVLDLTDTGSIDQFQRYDFVVLSNPPDLTYGSNGERLLQSTWHKYVLDDVIVIEVGVERGGG